MTVLVIILCLAVSFIFSGIEAGILPGGRKTKGLRILPMDFISDWTQTLRNHNNEPTEPNHA